MKRKIIVAKLMFQICLCRTQLSAKNIVFALAAEKKQMPGEIVLHAWALIRPPPSPTTCRRPGAAQCSTSWRRCPAPGWETDPWGSRAARFPSRWSCRVQRAPARRSPPWRRPARRRRCPARRCRGAGPGSAAPERSGCGRVPAPGPARKSPVKKKQKNVLLVL